MKISYNWLKNYLISDLGPQQLSEVLTDIGLEVESLEKQDTVQGGLDGIVIGEVLTKEKHPDADRLSVTTVNVGEGEPYQIVCGAPNVEVGQKVVVALPNSTLYPSGGEPFKIKKSKIRGVESNGMICAEDEIGLGESHAGIMVVDPSAKVGTPAAEFFQLESDFIFEIGLTPNRVDAASHYGVARDLYAALVNRGMKAELKRPETHLTLPSSPSPVQVVVESEACKRYSSLYITGVKVGPSPDWLQNRLRLIGLRPINNVVDVTNFVLHELGHPLHAFDAANISGKKVVVRQAKNAEKFTTLDYIERELNVEDLMICDAEKGMCLAGIFGGAHSGVTENTTEVFLESAWFDPAVTRKAARRHGLNTDASFRFERGADPAITVDALLRAASLIVELAGGSITSSVNDFYPQALPNHKVEISLSRMNSLIGKDLGESEVENILSTLEIKINQKSGDIWNLEVPAYRVDVTREVDVVEEVLRIHGFNNVELPQHLRASLSYSKKPDPDAVRRTVSNWLAALGLHESLSNSLTSSSYHSGYSEGEIREEWNVALLNPLSSELDIMRQTLLFNGLENIAHNQHRQVNDVRFFEFGKVYFKRGEKFEEGERLIILLSGSKAEERWNSPKGDMNFFTLRGILDELMSRLGLTNVFRLKESEQSLYAQGMRIELAGKKLGFMGQIEKALLKKMDIRQEVFAMELDWTLVLNHLHMNKVKYKEISKFPSVRRDLSLLLEKRVTFADIEELAKKTEKRLLREVGLFDVYEGKNLPEGMKSYAVFFVLQDDQKTLTDEVIEKTMERIQKSLEEKLGAQLR